MGRTGNKIQELEDRILKLESLLNGVNKKLEYLKSGLDWVTEGLKEDDEFNGEWDF